jgi:hypothetical protein
MLATTCNHQETIQSLGQGVDVGVCKFCGQTKRYEFINGKRVGKLVKLGRLDGKMVYPHEIDKLELSAQEANELKLAQKPVPKPAKEIPASNNKNGAAAPEPKQEKQSTTAGIQNEAGEEMEEETVDEKPADVEKPSTPPAAIKPAESSQPEKPIQPPSNMPPIQKEYRLYSKEDRKKIVEYAKKLTFNEAEMIYNVPRGILRVWNMAIAKEQRAAAGTTPPPKPDGKKKFRKCKQCKSHVVIDGKDRCTSKSCPSRYKEDLRPAYYTPEVQKAATKRIYKPRTPKAETPTETDRATLVQVQINALRAEMLDALQTTYELARKLENLAVYPAFDAKWSNDVCVAWIENYPKVLEIQNGAVALKTAREELIKTFREDFSKFLASVKEQRVPIEKADPPDKRRLIIGPLKRIFGRH